MSRSNEMLRRLQPFMRESRIYKGVFDAAGAEFEHRDAAYANLSLQLSVDTATWALPIYEKELGIPTDISKPMSDRRSVIKSKMRGTGQVDAALIKIVADSYTNGDVDVSFEDGTISVTFTSAFGVPSNIQDVYNAIEEIKPAHLALAYVFLYYTYVELGDTGLNYSDLVGLTYVEILNGELE